MKRTKKLNRGWSAWFAGAALSLFMGITALAQLTPPASSPITINDYPSLNPPYLATPYPSQIEVKDTVGVIEKIQVVLGTVNHSYSRDVCVLLVGPNGQSVTLMSNAGNGALASAKLTFEDGAAPLPETTPISSGTYAPTTYGGTTFPTSPSDPSIIGPTKSTFADAFKGISANGKWSLYVLDDKPFDSGFIGSWSISIYTTPDVTLSQTAISMLENSTTNITVTLKDSSTPESSIVVTATADDKNLFPDANLKVTGTGTTRNLEVKPALYHYGHAAITIKIDDGVQAVTTVLPVDVTHVNNPPTVSLNVNSVTVPLGQTATNLIAFPEDRDEDATTMIQNVTLRVKSSSDPAVVPPGGVFFTDANAQARPFGVTGFKEGTTTLVIEVKDPQGATGTTSLVVTITPAAPQPVFTKVDSITLGVGGGTASTPGTSTLTVANVAGPMGKVALTLVNVTNLNPSTLKGTLTNDKGVSISLASLSSASSGPVGFGALTFADQAKLYTTIPGWTTHTNVAVLVGDMSNVASAGKNLNGTWTLTLTGGGIDANSTIGGWTLRVYPAPQILNTADITIAEDTGIQAITFNVASMDGTVTNVSATIDDTSKATVKSASLAGGSLATVVISTVANAYGSTQIRYTATDNYGLSATVVQKLAITWVNDPPFVSFIEKKNTYLGTPILNVPFQVNDNLDYPNSAKDMKVGAASSNEKVVPASGILIQPPDGATQELRFISLFPTAAGDTIITVSVTDTNNVTSTSSFPVHVQDAGNLIWSVPGSITVAKNAKAQPFYPSTNVVKNMKGKISDVQVTLFNIKSENPGDLRVILVSPDTNKQPVMLMGSVIGNHSVSGATFVFSDAAPAPLPSDASVTSGVYQPSKATSADLTPPAPAAPYSNLLSTFDNSDPNGEWKLYIDSSAIAGSLGKESRIDGGWMLAIKTKPQLDPIKDQETKENVAITVPIVVGDEQPGDTVVTTVIGNPAVIASAVDVTGNGGARNLLVTPVLYTVGESTIQVIATDGGGNSSSTSFKVKVNWQALPAVISSIPDQSTLAGVAVAPITFTIWDPQWNAATNNTVDIKVTPGSPELISTITYDRTVDTFVGPNYKTGTNTFTLYIQPSGVSVGKTKISVDTKGLVPTSTSFMLEIKQNLAWGNPKPIVIPLGLPVDGLGVPYPSTFDLPNDGRGKVGGVVNKVRVTIEGFSHTWPEDVNMLLVGPNGKAVTLMNGVGGNTPVSGARLTFADDGETFSGAIVSGKTYKPTGNGALVPFPAPAPQDSGNYKGTLDAAFNGADPNGPWSLYIVDDAYPDGGEVSNGWMVFVETRPKINDLASVTMDENGTGTLKINVTDATMLNQSNIVVTATLSDGTDWFSNSVPVVQGTTATERYVGIFPKTNAPSSVKWSESDASKRNVTGKVTVTAKNDNNVVTTGTFDLALLYKNQLPYIVGTTDINMEERTSDTKVTLTFKIGDVDSKWHGTNTLIYPADKNMFPKQADNYKLTYPTGLETDGTKAPNQNPIGNPPDSTSWPVYQIDFKPVLGTYGTNNFYIVQYNNDGRAATNVIVVGVKNILNPPTFTVKNTSPFTATAGTLSTNLVIQIDTSYEVPAADLQVTVVSGDATRIPNDTKYIQVTKGSDSAKRNVAVIPVGNASGSMDIPMTVTVKDLVNNLSTTKQFTCTVLPQPVYTRYASVSAPAFPAGKLTFFDVDATGFQLKGPIDQVAVVLDGLVTPSPADLDIGLEAVALTGETVTNAVMLMAAAGDGNAINAGRIAFDMSGAAPVPQFDPIGDGIYKPANYNTKLTLPAPAPQKWSVNLADFKGQNPNRIWRLWVNNRGTADAKLLGNWLLSLVTAPKLQLADPSQTTITINANTKASVIVNVLDDYVSSWPSPSDRKKPPTVTISAASTDTVLLDPVRSIDFGDSYVQQRTITLSPQPYQSGTTKVTLTVTHSGISSSLAPITLNVNPINDPPVFSRLEPTTTPEGTPKTIVFVVTDPDSQLKNISLKAETSDEGVISKTNITLNGVNPLNGLPGNTVPQSSIITLVAKPTPNTNGPVDITLTATDPMTGVKTNVVTVTQHIDVVQYNWPPVFEGIKDQTMSAGGTAEFAFKVSSATRPTQTITVTGNSGDQTLVKDADIISDPSSSVNVDRKLRITAQNWAGNTPKVVRINLTAKYNNPGEVSSSTSFVLTILPPRAITFENRKPITIIDNSRASDYPSIITVTGLQGNVRSVKATIDGFGHSFPSDVAILLVSPTGQKVVLMNKAGASSAAVSGLSFNFTQTAANPIPGSGNLTSGDWKPANYNTSYVFPDVPPDKDTTYATTMDAFKGHVPAGDWKLYITDTVSGDSGVITNGWSLTIETEPRFVGLTDVAMSEGSASTQRFTIADDSRYNPTYTLTGASSDTTIIPNANIVFDPSTGTNRSITVTPAVGKSGSNVVISVTVLNSDGQTVTTTFKADVLYKQSPPSVATVADQTVETGSFKTVPFSYSDAHTPVDQLKVGVQSTAPAVLPTSGIKVTPTSITLTPVPGQTGQSQVTITVTNVDNLTASTTFNVTVIPSTTPTYSQPGAITIPDSGKATPYPSTIAVSSFTGNVVKVAVTIAGFSHTFPSDVSILLVGPQGQGVVLLSRVGAGISVSNVSLTFDDAAAAPLSQYDAITDGIYKVSDYKSSDFFPSPAPVAPYDTALATFAGKDPNGTWSLYVNDEIAPDHGAINYGWSIALTTSAGKTMVISKGPSLGISQVGQDLSISLAGAPNADYTIQSTSDMTNWTDAGTVTADDNGKAEYSVKPTATGAQFFRALAK